VVGASDPVHKCNWPILEVVIQVKPLVQVQVVDRQLVSASGHSLIYEQLLLPSQKWPEEWVLNEVNSFLPEIDLLEELPTIHVHVVHHPCCIVPVRVGKSLGETPG
jgi:hypothetical protein